jgi:hypothetical protein
MTSQKQTKKGGQMSDNFKDCYWCGQAFTWAKDEPKNELYNGYSVHQECDDIWSEFRYRNAKEAVKRINSIDSIPNLYKIIEIETNRETRKTVLDAAANRIFRLEGAK